MASSLTALWADDAYRFEYPCRISDVTHNDETKETQMGLYAIVAVGGGAAVGAWLRWGLGTMLNPIFPTVPLGTLSANLLGGYLIGMVLGILSHYESLPPEIRLLMTTGFLGGLTTFSTFSAETVTLIVRGQYGWAAAVVMFHVIGSLVMTGMGIMTMGFLRN